MFIHNFKYTIRFLIKAKTSLFWAFIFPLALSTFMYLAFYNIMSVDEEFHAIPVAVVEGESEAGGVRALIDALSGEDDALLDARVLSDDEAKQALNNGEIDGIIYTEDTSLAVADSSISAAILESILTQYKQNEAVMLDIAKTHPDKLPELMDSVMDRPSFYVENASTDGNQNPYTNYFYAIFAMSCLYAAFSSVTTTSNMQANTSPLGMRKCVSASRKSALFLSDFTALLLVHFAAELVTFGYMSLLGIDFGNKYPAIILTLLLGCIIGLALGTIVGAISQLKQSMRIGILLSGSMVLSILADLVAGGVKDLIEHHAPIINRINPAALISDCLYSLNVYDSYSRYFENTAILAAESAVLIFVSFMMIRRNKYASI